MAIDFPDSPAVNDEHSSGGRTWRWNGEKWLVASSPLSLTNLDDIGDVSAASPSDGEFLKYLSASSAWVPAAIPTINALDDVGDVDISMPADGEYLRWTGSKWANDAIELGSDTTGDYLLEIVAGTGIAVTHVQSEGSTASVALSANLEDLNNVDLSGLAGGRVLQYSSASSAWIAGEIPTISALDDISDVAAPSPSTGDVLKWSGSAWVSDAIDLGTDTTGNYVSDVTAGTGVTVTHTPGEGSSPTVAIGQSVATSASVTFATVSTTGDVTVGGNLTVNGTSTTLNTETLSVEDNIIVLNSNVSASPVLDAGIEVERGTLTNVAIKWNETTDTWQFTNDGTTYSDLGSGGGVTVSSTAPVGPNEGDLWFDSDTAQTFVYYDSNWVEVGTIAGSAKILVSSTAPSSPLEGELWFDSDTGATYVYYSSTWVEVGAAPFDALLNKVDAKGDILVATSDNNVERLPVGTDGFFLKANSSASAGIEWASIPTINALDDVGDVSASAPTTGYFLQWNGSAWVPAAVSADVMTDSKNAAIITMDIIGG
jgi:hypothetical protein